ncbi:unnamed protein product [Danaus chrysippus]|uniref:(African queen) hypothetical protein n=1 Tax=Danaus chrysippus TaxID=151541 RepID=A0A8J2VW94_9NEOP|nr:unnamed protein product [Danaus chrysippus]
MVQRLFFTTRWLFCLSVFHTSLTLVRTVSVPTKEPYGIEAQAKFFQDFFSVQLSPYKIEFGHVCEDPHTWEQRYEKKDFKNHRDMGKVRWGDKNGGYGEHYWDLNHAGYTDNHGDDYNGDDGSYHEEPSDAYSGPDDTGSYDSESYSDDLPQYEETGRIKRAHSKTSEQSEDDDDYEEPPRPKQRIRTKNKNRRERYEEIHEDDQAEDIEPTTKSPKIKSERIIEEEDTTEVRKSKNKQKEHRHERPQQEKEKNHFVLVVNEKEREEEPDRTRQTKPQPSEPKRFVKYEDGAGVRQHTSPEALASASAPRLFLETQTGHIVDRMTGQAYVLQPVANKYNK